MSSPIFAEASKHVNAFRLIAVGLGIWALATAGCGLAQGFWSLLLCRMLVGVGEASFVALASPFIGSFRPLPFLPFLTLQRPPWWPQAWPLHNIIAALEDGEC